MYLAGSTDDLAEMLEYTGYPFECLPDQEKFLVGGLVVNLNLETSNVEISGDPEGASLLGLELERVHRETCPF